MKLVILIFSLQVALHAVEKIELPKGFETFEDKASFQNSLSEKDYALITTSLSLCNTCPLAVEQIKRSKKILRTIEREIDESVQLFYWTNHQYKKMESIIGAKPCRAILCQNPHYIVSSVLISTKDQSVLLEGKLGSYNNKSKREDNKCIQTFLDAINELTEAGDTMENQGLLSVVSKNNKTIELLPLSIEGDILRYGFKGKVHKIELAELSRESVVEIKNFLN